MTTFGFQSAPTQPAGEEPRLWRQWAMLIARVLNRTQQGKLNCATLAAVTLTANATSTTLTDPLIGVNSHIILTPTTTTARDAWTTIYVSVTGNGVATINHASTADTDKTFKYSVLQ